MTRNINIILNEFTLHGQYKSEKAFYQNNKLLSDIINYVKEISKQINDVKINLKKHNSILDKSLIIKNRQSFDYEQIKTLENNTNKTTILTLLKQFLAIPKNNTKVILSPCSYFIYDNCSYSHIFEEEDKDFYIFLSFNDSYYKNTQIDIYKDDMSSYRNIYFVNSLDKLKNIIKENFYILDHQNSPNDIQTFLRYSDEFETTDMDNQGRKVFYNKSLSRFYVIDNLHKHGSAEIEIFDKNKKHIGTALSLENFNLNKLTKEDGRSLS